jgi:hypothetical protein
VREVSALVGLALARFAATLLGDQSRDAQVSQAGRTSGAVIYEIHGLSSGEKLGVLTVRRRRELFPLATGRMLALSCS